MSMPTGPADRIRLHLSRVESLRTRASEVGVDAAVITIKRLQAMRFAETYRDFLASAEYAAAARFFLEELYGVRDFRTRDQQFARIAGGLERLFPPAVAELAVDLSELHALTERLDHEMASRWVELSSSSSLATRYVQAWTATGTRDDRARQLAVVARMGAELEQLTRKRSLRTALRLMRAPARAAGLDALQIFLESGFDAFGSMKTPTVLMQAIATRESAWIERLYRPDAACLADLDRTWHSFTPGAQAL